MSDRRRFSRWERIKIFLIAAVGSAAVGLIGRTLRFEARGAATLDSFREQRRPVILSFWHNQIFPATYYFRDQEIVVITSSHFDGEYIARIIHRFGYGTARGSSSRGAVRALLQLKRQLASGRDVAFTIDGPRGPIYRVKPGPIFLARKAGCPILCFHIEPEKFWSLKGWDRFRIPRPFSRAVVQFGDPLVPGPDESDEECLGRYQQEMERIQQLAIQEARNG